MPPSRPKGPPLSAWPPGAAARRGPAPLPGMRPPRSRRPPDQQADFESLRASLLFCPKCRQATPTRERLLLVLPTGNLYEYLCAQCGTSTGSKTSKEQEEVRLFRP